METEAASEDQARLQFCYGLAQKHGMQLRVMRGYFNGKKDNYEIREVKQ
jgi:hypothetical protein